MNRYVLVFLILTGSPLFARAQNSDSAKINYQSDSILSAPTSLKFSFKQAYVPAGLIGIGIATVGNGSESLKNEIVEERDEHFSAFRTHIDNYLQYSPIAIAYGLDALGISSKTDFTNRSVILFKGEVLMFSSVTLLKHFTHERRPDGSNFQSFPSGHTAQAFAAATFLSEEYKNRFKWMPYAAYGLASGVGILRMANNKHYISDVLMGAGLGIISMKVAYWTHQYHWGKRRRSSRIQ